MSREYNDTPGNHPWGPGHGRGRRPTEPQGTVLITGMSRDQCGVNTRFQIGNATKCWARALRWAGYEVDQRAVWAHEDLSGYDYVLVGLMHPGSIAAQQLFGGLTALIQRPDALCVVDDWQCWAYPSGFRTFSAWHHRIWRFERPGLTTARQTDEAAYEAKIDEWAAGRWPRPVVACVHGGSRSRGRIGALRLPAHVYPVDPTAFQPDYPVKARSKERRWLWASLLKKMDQLEKLRAVSSWPVTAYGNADKKKGIGKKGKDAQPQVPEPELAQEYNDCWGVYSPSHPVSGSGWWRVRYKIARDVGSVLCGPPSEASLFGDAYEAATDPAKVCAMTDAQLEDLAARQRAQFDELTQSREEAAAALVAAMEEAAEGA